MNKEKLQKVRKIAKRVMAGAIEDVLAEEEAKKEKKTNAMVAALADYLGIEEGDITKSTYGEHYFETPSDGEYLVYDNEEDAQDAAIESVENTLEDCGIEVVNGWENFINTDYFDYDRQNYWDDYARDISREDDKKFGNRLVQEAYEYNVIDDDDFEVDEDGNIDYTDCKKSIDDLVDAYGEYCYNEDDPIDWITQCYPKNQLLQYCPGCVKLGDLAEYVVRNDGRGPQLSSWDSKEIEYSYNNNVYYIYKIDD